MATVTASNQQYYHGYPVAQGDMTANPAVVPSAYHHHHQQQASHHYGSSAANHFMTSQMHQTHHELQTYQQQHHHQQHLVAAGTPIGAATTTSGSEFGLDDAKSTKKASKQRRDAINKEIAILRDLLPLPDSTRQRLSQLQLMALVLVYVRKSNYFCNAFRNLGIARDPSLMISASGFSKALNGFLMMLTQKGKLLYISDNAAEYLGHSMEDLLSHGDEVYDIIEDQDKKTIRTELLSNDDETTSSPSLKSSASSTCSPSSSNGLPAGQLPQVPTSETRIALCRMNVSRNARRQMRFGDQKVVLIEGHYLGVLPLSSRDEPVFLATCTPIAMPETRECIVQGSTNVFTSIHSMDMKILYLDGIGEHYLECTKQQVHGTSWYELVHVDHLGDAQTKHKRITASEQERSTICLLRLMNFQQTKSVWVHSVMQVKDSGDGASQPVIVCTNQVLSEREAQVMRSNSWLYQFYSLHSRLHCNFSASSPSQAADQTIRTPDSVANSESVALNVVAADETLLAGPKAANKSGSGHNKSIMTKTPPESIKLEQQQVAADKSLAASPPTTSSSRSTTGAAKDLTSALYAHQQVAVGANYQPIAGYKSKLPPLTHSPSSTVSSHSPLSSSGSSYQQQANQRNYHQLTVPSTLDAHSASIASAAASLHHQLQGAAAAGGSLGGSSSASSISSNSSASSTSSSADLSLSAQSAMAVAAAAGNASLYAVAGLDPSMGADPLAMGHHQHHHSVYSQHFAANQQHQYGQHQQQAHQQQPALQLSASSQSHIGHAPHHHHAHHQAYHPYAHPHHHPAHHSAQHHHQQSHHQHGQQAVQSAAAGLYTPTNHHHQMAYGTHHSAAAYHSAAAAAAAGMHHAHHQSSSAAAAYHSAAAGAAAAAAAAAHQGVSFHTYNKIAAAVNASA